MLKINYDKTYDIMYVSVGNKANSYGDEKIDGLVIMKDLDTDEITGFTVFGFKKRLEEGSLYDLTISDDINLRSMKDIFDGVLN